MPVINLEVGNLSPEQKKELITKFTEVAVEVTNIPKQFFVVTIRELPDENLGIGGETVAEIKTKIGN